MARLNFKTAKRRRLQERTMTVTQYMAMLVNSLIRKHLFARPSFIRAYFGLRVVAPASVQSRCEWGTIAQRRLLAQYVRPGMHILEVGAGANALLSISIKRQWPSATVVATDILPERDPLTHVERKVWEFAMLALFLEEVGRLDERTTVLAIGAGD